MPAETYEYGAPLLTRVSDIITKVSNSTTRYPLEVMGKYQHIPQITVRIGYPVYRIGNGRTRTFQKEYLAVRPDEPSDLFTKDPESLKAQRAQHSILQKLVDDEDLLKEFRDGTPQTDPIIVTRTGVVVNGNRRLCAWRTLYSEDPEKYKSFEFIEVAVLPEDCDEEEIKKLEKRLQIQKTHRAEYKWHNKAAMMKEERESGASVEYLAKSYDVQKKDVELLIGALEYADIYLDSIGKDNQWSLVDGDEFAFKSMVDERKKFSDQGKKELFEAVCFKLIEQKDYEGRLYSIIPDIAEHLEIFATELREKGLLPQTTDVPDSGETSSKGNADEADILGDDDIECNEYSELASAVTASDVRLGGFVKQVIEDQKALKSEQKNAMFLLNMLAKASKLLLNAEQLGLTDNVTTAGVRTHLIMIKECVANIELWLDEHGEH